MDKGDLERLKKLHCVDVLDLVLHAPRGYEDTRVSNELLIGHDIVAEIEVIDFSMLPRAKRAKGVAKLISFDEIAELTIFNPSQYHRALFKRGERFFIRAKVERFMGNLTLIQPQKLSKTGEIKPKFATKVMRGETLSLMAKRLITQESLKDAGIPLHHAKNLVLLFSPDEAFLACYLRDGGFSKETMAALKFVEIFRYIRDLSRKKRNFHALQSCKNSPDFFIDSLPFALTKGQESTIEALRGDLASDMAARRVIMGDVGCGKTVVILAAAVIAYPYLSVLMAPTTVLARQLFGEAKRLLPSDFNISLITHDKSEESSGANLIIGTHALLYRKELGEAALVMIDEQHRFGTSQRSMLERLLSGDSGKRAHVLQFSATPIPRTLALIESSLIDFSFIKDTPYKKDILTRIIGKSDFAELLRHIKSEVLSGNQAAIIYPLVEESEHLDYLSLKEGESFWRKHFAKVYVTHGKDKEKESVMEGFRENGEVLLATTVIEVGISLPRLSTIVIVGAERLGLATLHQLRGRVSRTGLKGYCYLYTNLSNSKRLSEFSATLSGFEIAELDLKYRQSGDLLRGERQSGENFTYFEPSEDEVILHEARASLAEKGVLDA
ncbi:MAG: ATP-dependent DNA helicase RecG [Wolinella sp.]